MRLLTPALLAIVLASLIPTCLVPAAGAQEAGASPDAAGPAAAAATTVAGQESNENSKLTIPAGTRVELSLTSPVWSHSVKAGEAIYGITNFPVAIQNQIVIPQGTYVQGQIDSFSKPGWLEPHAGFQIHFTKMIFANGYTADLTAPRAAEPAGASDVARAYATPRVQVSSSSDILLDNGTQIEMIVQLPVELDAASVQNAAEQTNPALPGHVPSATMCRAIPGTPGTPDTVIPGTPGTPGTPPTVIPSGTPGVPDTVIPGTPATPGTPDTVIPGTAGSPGRVCPAPPMVVSDGKAETYGGSFSLTAPVTVGGTTLAAGKYEARWTGPAASGEIEILEKGKHVAAAQARILMLDGKAAASTPEISANGNGLGTLVSLRFAGQALALYFDSGAAPAAP